MLKIQVLKLLTLITVDENLPKNLSEYTVYLYFFMKLQIIIMIKYRTALVYPQNLLTLFVHI